MIQTVSFDWELVFPLKSKSLDIELMRILAAFFVIFNHTGDYGFFLFSLCDRASLRFWLYGMLSVFCKFSVPLFFMITGGLLLSKEENFSKIFRHRILRILLILFCWSLFYYFRDIGYELQAFHFGNFLEGLYDSSWNVSFWYLYAYIALLVSLPLLRRLCKALTNREYLYWILIVLFFSAFLPMTEYRLWQGRLHLNINLDWMLADILFFPCLGYFLRYRMQDFWNSKRLAILWSVNTIAILISVYMTYYKAGVTGECNEVVSQDFLNSFTLINCVAIFTTCQYFFSHAEVKDWLAKGIQSIGGATFGIYLIHLFVMRVIYDLGLLTTLTERLHINHMISVLIYTAAIFIVSYLITLLMKKIPGLKRLI